MMQRQRYPALGTKTGQAFKRNASKQRTNQKNKAITRQDAIDRIPAGASSVRESAQPYVQSTWQLKIIASRELKLGFVRYEGDVGNM